MSEVRVRFAPSPTGFLHIGGARTALFNWLYARHHHGKFFLRIEDTDRSRSTEEAVEAILDGMRWLGLAWDRWEGATRDPVLQTDRLEIYRRNVTALLDKGNAYRCYCTAQELEARRNQALSEGKVPRYDGRCRNLLAPIPGKKSAIRFKAEVAADVVIEDMVKGKVSFDASTIDDLIILRSDGNPTYNFCVVVDDVEMKITHVIRGDDHLNNTPRQIQLYQALGYTPPQFGHVSMILGADRARLSKRHGATSVQQYREEGYLPEAMVNYLVRLGWSYKDQELFTMPEMIEKFAMDQVGASAAVFNPEKLLWVNAHHIKNGDPARMAALLLPFLERLGIAVDTIETSRLVRVVTALRERSRTLVEMAESAFYFFSDEITYHDKARGILTEESLPALTGVMERLMTIPFEHQPMEEAFKALGKALGIKMADVAQPVRAAVTGKTVSPGIFEVLEILGREKTLSRLKKAVTFIIHTRQKS